MRIVLACAAATLVAAATAAGAPSPTVTLVQASPAVVAGHGYAPHAHVAIAYRSGSTHAGRSITATAAGTFQVTFANIHFERCKGLSLAAGAAALHVASCDAGGRPLIVADGFGVVTGKTFVPGERVKVVVSETGVPSVSSAVTAGAAGTFKMKLTVRHVACVQVDYVATGALGSHAAFTLPTPDCTSR